MGVIPVRQDVFGNGLGASGAFGHVLAGEFDMNTAGMGSFGFVDCKEPFDFAQNLFERPRLVTSPALDGIAVHGIASPDNSSSLAFYRAYKGWQTFFHLVVSHAADQNQPPGVIVRIENVDQTEKVVGSLGWASLDANRIGYTAHELDMGAIGLPGPVADPHHVCRRVVPITRCRVDPDHRFLISEQQGSWLV